MDGEDGSSRGRLDGGARLAGVAIVVAALAVALAGLSVTVAPSSASPKAPHGFFGMVAGAEPFDAPDLQGMDESGVTAVRFLLYWPSVEPAGSSPDWTATDEAVGNLAAQGIQPDPFVYGSPGWVADDPTDPPIATQADRNEWKAFLVAAVERYGPGGDYWTDPGLYSTQHPGAKALPIRAWQIWNEPNLKRFFNPGPSPTKYATLVRMSHDAIKSRDPGAKIVLAGMPGFGDLYAWKFLDKLYRVHGIKGDFDAAALHPYSPSIHQLKRELKNIRRVMRRHGDANTPLWLTEIGWGSAHPDGSLSKGLAGQKNMLTKSFKLLIEKRRDWHIGRVFWFDWRDPVAPATPPRCKFCPTAGLLKHNRDPKPALNAYRRFAR